MKKSVNIIYKAVLAIGTAALIIGCEPGEADRSLRVGKVDTAILLRDDPKYQNLSIEYMKENMALREKFLGKMKSAGESDSARQEVQKSYSEEQKKLDGKWMKKTQDFLDSTHTNIKDLAKKIAESKDIDIVIVDSKEYPTVEWGGVDITPDLALSKTQSPSSDPSTSQSPTPEAKKES